MTHEEAVELLPWLVNGSLRSDESDAVSRHATACVACRREIRQLEVLKEGFDRLSAAVDVPDADMRSINARIDARMARGRLPGWLHARIAAALGTPWRFAFAVQTVLVLALGAAWLSPSGEDAAYTTLTAVESLPSGDYVRVVFDPALSDASLQQLVAETGMVIVAGPSRRGVYTLGWSGEVPEEHRDAVIASLRRQETVLLAEPVRLGNR